MQLRTPFIKTRPEIIAFFVSKLTTPDLLIVVSAAMGIIGQVDQLTSFTCSNIFRDTNIKTKNRQTHSY